MGFVLAPSPTQATNLYYALWYVGFVGFGVIVFVVPLLGLHGRLVDEKERLQGEADDRLKGILAELNRDAGALELGRADALNKTLASLVQQRELLARLPTWPWSTTTLRAFVSAILLPLALFVVQRVLGPARLTAGRPTPARPQSAPARSARLVGGDDGLDPVA